MRELRMPRLELGDGQGDEIFIVEWLIGVGAEVCEGDPVLTVETAKAQMEVEAPFDGVLFAQDALAGDRVLSGGPLGRFTEAGVQPVLDLRMVPETLDSPNQTSSARSEVPGLIYGRKRAQMPGPMSSNAARTTASPNPSAQPEAMEVPVELTRARIAIGHAMSASAAIPQFSVQVQADVKGTLEHLSEIRAGGLLASVTDLLLRAVALALVKNPSVNVRVINGRAYHQDGVSIAVAVDTKVGVMAPVIHKVDRLSLLELVAERRRVVAGAREGKLAPRDLGGASFTISNLGTMDIDAIIPLLSPPQAAALGVGTIRKLSGRDQMTLTFVGDHRVLDGADGARFLTCLREELESINSFQVVV